MNLAERFNIAGGAPLKGGKMKGDATVSHKDIIEAVGLSSSEIEGGTLEVRSPIDGSRIAGVRETPPGEMPGIVARAKAGFLAWRDVPPPRRGELIRLFAEELRAGKADPRSGRHPRVRQDPDQEGLGEVQEMIDICDFAVGLSRQLYGLTIASERPGHRHARDVASARGCAASSPPSTSRSPSGRGTRPFSLVCGNPVVWKPSEKTPLTALAVQQIASTGRWRAFGDAPDDLLQVVIGGREIGERTGRRSPMSPSSAPPARRPHGPQGRAESLAARFRPLHPGARRQQRHDRRPLGGPGHGAPGHRLLGRGHQPGSAVPACGGSSCTIGVYDRARPRLKAAYEVRLSVGDPLDDGTLVGPLIDAAAPSTGMHGGRWIAGKADGGEVHGGGQRELGRTPTRAPTTPRPAIVEMPEPDARSSVSTRPSPRFSTPMEVRRPSTRRRRCTTASPQGLSSCIFSDRPARGRASSCPTVGSDCGHRERQHRPRAGPRSAAPSAARRRPAAAANPDPTRGRATCAGRPTPSTIRANCRSPKASRSISDSRACALRRGRRGEFSRVSAADEVFRNHRSVGTRQFRIFQLHARQVSSGV